MITLRKYQEDVVKIGIDFFNNKKIKKNGIICSPLGSGKSIMIASIANSLDNCIILQPTGDLLEQNYEKFTMFGGQATIYSDSLKQKNISKKVFATIGTIKNLAQEFKALGVKNIIMDECHMFSNKDDGMFKKFFKELGDIKILGFTATPFKNAVCRGDDHKFDNYVEIKILTRMNPRLFSNILYNITPMYMIENDYWKSIRYKLKKVNANTLKLNSTKSDYTDESLKLWYESGDVEKIVIQDVQEQILQGKKTILIFMPSVDLANKMATMLPNAYAISAKTPKKERRELLKKMKNKPKDEVMILVNFGVLTVGVDIPDLDLLINARPVNSMEIHIQMYGRLVRKSENVSEGLIIDYTSNAKKFGRIEEIEMDYVEDYGWGLFNGDDRVLNNVRLDRIFVYKNDLRKIKENSIPIIKFEQKVMPLGKYEGLPINSQKISLEYLEFVLKNSNFVGVVGKKDKTTIENEIFKRKHLK